MGDVVFEKKKEKKETKKKKKLFLSVCMFLYNLYRVIKDVCVCGSKYYIQE